MPILLFAFTLTVLDVAIYGLMFSSHAFFVKGFSISSAAAVGGYQVIFRVVYLQAMLQLAAICLAYRYLRSPGYIAVIVCAVISFLAVALTVLNANLITVWVLFSPNIVSWELAEGFVLLLSVTVSWLATAVIWPIRAPVFEKVKLVK
ncbi:MAG: hypothetical protein R3F50_17095 [Gammaproteobacteria bacterium]|jgi:hypothetical protein